MLMSTWFETYESETDTKPIVNSKNVLVSKVTPTSESIEFVSCIFAFDFDLK